jgi:isopentenyl-diphosphate delta-isomerase
MLNPILQGKVVKGEAQGRQIGFPTANLDLPKKPGVKPGVYAALVTLKQKNYLGLAYFGPRYIFGETRDNFEVYIFNFNQDIYREKLTVKLLKFLRAPKKVNNLNELKKLLQSDLTKLDRDVILVDKQDKIVGIESKLAAHQGKAKLHRAISVQLFNRKGELLIQQRSKYKRLFPLVWANTVCTDVRPYETYQQAAQRRLKEEFGLKASLTPAFKFNYSARWQSGSEREIDQAFFGRATGQPKPDSKEIADWKYVSLKKAKQLVKDFAPWFQIILKKLKPSDIVIS